MNLFAYLLCGLLTLGWTMDRHAARGVPFGQMPDGTVYEYPHAATVLMWPIVVFNMLRDPIR